LKQIRTISHNKYGHITMCWSQKPQYSFWAIFHGTKQKQVKQGVALTRCNTTGPPWSVTDDDDNRRQ